MLAGRLATADIIAALKDAGLRGMGGAGFPAGRKWDLVAAQEAAPKYVICNADESEPGTFKDREILAAQPYLVLEGLLLGMLAVGAEEGWVFIRHEYGPEEQVIRAEIEWLRAAGLVGPNAAGDRQAAVGRGVHLPRRLHPRRGVGADRVHGGTPGRAAQQAAVPRHLRPARPAHADELGRDVRPRARSSPAAARTGGSRPGAAGRSGAEHAGLKFFAVSGHVERPGVYCVPMGTTARELLDLAGGVSEGRNLGAIQPGGASSNFIGPDQLDVELDFGTLQAAGSMLGSGAMVVMAEGTDLLAAAVNVLRFFRDESCGKCVPCRVGSAKAHIMLADLLASGGGPADVNADVRELIDVMRRTSICGLGQVALGPVSSVLRLAGGGHEG